MIEIKIKEKATDPWTDYRSDEIPEGAKTSGSWWTSNKPPRIKGEQAIRAFCKDGYLVVRISGTPHYLRHPQKPIALSIPIHKGHILGVGLLASKIKDAGLTVEEFKALL